MSVRSGWERWWFQDAPYFDLAVLRVGAVGLQCFLLLSKIFGEMIYVVGLPTDLYAPLPLMRIFMLPWGWGARPEAQAMMVIFWVTMASGLTSFVGFRTTLSLWVFALGNLFVQAYIYSFHDFHHPEAIMMIGLLALALGPSGRVLSVDSWIRNRSVHEGASVAVLYYVGRYARWPIKFLQCYFPLMYLSAVACKMATSSLTWANGYTLQYYFIHDNLRKGGGLALAMWASQFHDALAVIQVVVLVFQVTFFLIVFFPRLRWIYLPLGIGFHLANYWILEADFPQWILFYAVYIPWAQVVKHLAAARVLPETLMTSNPPIANR